MFQVLIVLACVCIGIGFYGKRSEDNYEQRPPIKSTQDREEEIKEIKERMNLIEEFLFQDMGSFKEELENQMIEYSSKEEKNILYGDESPKTRDMVHDAKQESKEKIQVNEKYLEQYKKLCEYESKDYTLEQISSLLEMQKGELLLLKSLFNNIST